jgi:transposase-like protein
MRTEPVPPPIETVLAAVREARFNEGVRCPRCGAVRVHAWGTFSGRRRYRCTKCTRTFSDLTGTPAAYVKKLALWGLYGDALAASVSVRGAAALLGINPTTAFRWRHRLLSDVQARQGETLHGSIELATTHFAYSEKGQRHLGRTGRRRGLSPCDWMLHHRVCVLVACDRCGHVRSAVCLGHRPSVRDLEIAVARPKGLLILCAAQGRFGPASCLAVRRGGVFLDARTGRVRPSGPMRQLVHIRTTQGYVSRLRSWLQRFRGVATKYLANYLTWHSRIDRNWRQGLAAEVLRWPYPGTYG